MIFIFDLSLILSIVYTYINIKYIYITTYKFFPKLSVYFSYKDENGIKNKKENKHFFDANKFIIFAK